MRNLTHVEIESLASGAGVRRVAVENFLFSVDSTIGLQGNMANLRQDTHSYKWNTVTAKAIAVGLRNMFKG